MTWAIALAVGIPTVALLAGITAAGFNACARREHADPDCMACGGAGEVLSPVDMFGLDPCPCLDDPTRTRKV